MNRGDIFAVAGGVGPAAKPRPCLIVQRSSALELAPKVTVCPITSGVRIGSSIRPIIHPSQENGLITVSQVEIDWIYTYRVERLGVRIGLLDEHAMRDIDEALRLWLDL